MKAGIIHGVVVVTFLVMVGSIWLANYSFATPEVQIQAKIEVNAPRSGLGNG